MKKRDILKIIFIFIVIFSIMVIKPINSLDEIWNYNTARAIAEGLIPYKDVSMITTPLLPMTTAIFLKIFTNEIIISRILAAMLCTGILYTTYKILKQLIKEENTALICTGLIGIVCRKIYCIDYNVTVLFLALIILNQELKNIKNVTQYNKKQDFIIGLLAGLAMCTKQSIGTTLAIVVIGYKLLFVENKQQFKEYIKIAGTRAMGIMLPVTLIFIYLIISNALNDFINYAILGISTFSNKIEYVSLFNNGKIEIRILAVVVPISIIIMSGILIITSILKKENKSAKEILTLLVYSLSIIIVMYPISDEIHFLIGSFISIISTIYIISLIGKKAYDKIKYDNKFKSYKIITFLIWILIFASFLYIAIYNMYEYIKTEKNTEIQHFRFVTIDDDLTQRIKEIDNYVLEKEYEGKRVYILDAEAAIYMIPINKYNKNYDMFLKGNIGKDGEEGQIKIIKQCKENDLFLIRKENIKTNWQTPLNVVNYIRENLEKINEISIYDVYKHQIH